VRTTPRALAVITAFRAGSFATTAALKTVAELSALPAAGTTSAVATTTVAPIHLTGALI
jgi:hypothetical protein